MQGRSPTCYSPVRRSSTTEVAFPLDLHVLSTPPAFVLSQNQTLQTKTTQPKKSGEFTFGKIRYPNKRHQNWHQKTNHPTRQEDGESPTEMAKNNKQKPPNTLLSSQTTHPVFRQPCHCTPLRQRGQTRSANPFGLGPLASGLKTTPPTAQSQNGIRLVQAIRSISAPRLTKFSTNSG